MKKQEKKNGKTSSSQNTIKVKKMKMEFLRPSSRWVKNLLYHRDEKKLFIETNNGSQYEVSGISFQRWNAIKSSPSTGKILSRILNQN
jgi:hypothetical protein